MSFEEINKVNLISFILLKKFNFDAVFGIIVNADLNHKDQRFLWQPHYTLVACLNMTPMSVLDTPFLTVYCMHCVVFHVLQSLVTV